MAMKTFCDLRRNQELDVEKADGEEDEGRDSDSSSQPSPGCPACNRHHDVVLILPCSHTMCARCVAAGEKSSSARPLHHGVCSVLCPRCQHPVELPCRTWSSAASCLPKHPRPSPAGITEDGAPEGRLHEAHTHTWDLTKDCLHGPNADSSPIAPVGGTVDLQEEEMEQSVFGLRLALDPASVPPSLHLSNSLTVSYRGPGDAVSRPETASDPGVTPALPQVCANVVVARGQYYWEVDVCNSSVYRIGVISLDGGCGWWLERQGLSFRAVYDGSWEPLRTVPPQIKSLGVFLNVGGGALSFHNPVSHEHLATLPTRFGRAGVQPALGLGQGRLRLRCPLPPPPHIFLSKDSSYRGPVTDRRRWHGGLHFRSVREVIERFEELAASDSDSGLLSSAGSSRSTMASIPDVGTAGILSSGLTE